MIRISETWIYLSGPISGRSPAEAKAHFSNAETLVRWSCPKYCYVSNPTNLPEGWTWNDYMRAGIRELLICDAILMLDGWNTSAGAVIEKDLAQKLGIKVYYESELREALDKPWIRESNEHSKEQQEKK